MKAVGIVCALFLPLMALAQAPLSPEEAASAVTEPLELDPLMVSEVPWTLQQETTLRFVRRALETARSDRREDIDEWVCWFEKTTGSHLSYLKCARNGDLWALRPDGGGAFGSVMDALPQGLGGYGKILVSTRPANRAKIKKALESLPGSIAFDEEFIQIVAQGGEPPQDVPPGDELDRFAVAYRAVQRLDRGDASDEELIDVIEKAGLTLRRYNRIAELAESFESIRTDIASRLEP